MDDLNYEPQFNVICSEDGDDRSTAPFGERYADHGTLLDYDVRIAEWHKTDGVFIVVGSDIVLSDDDHVALNGYRSLEAAIGAAKTWYVARAAL